MSRPSIRISIPKPCHEQWDGMTSTERGAFCQSCQTEVIDFSTMTDREVVEYLSKNKAGCGRFRNDQLDTNLTAPSVKNNFSNWRIIILGFLSFISLKQALAFSKHPSCEYVTQPIITNDSVIPKQATISVYGNVKDEKGINVANAEVSIIGANEYLGMAYTTTDSLGNFNVVLDKKYNSLSPLYLKVCHWQYHAKTKKIQANIQHMDVVIHHNHYHLSNGRIMTCQ